MTRPVGSACGRPDSAVALLGNLLLAGDRATRALLRSGVRMRPLTAHREAATMADSAIRADVHQSFDVHRHLGAKRALDLEIAVDHLTKPGHIGIGEVANAQ